VISDTALASASRSFRRATISGVMSSTVTVANAAQLTVDTFLRRRFVASITPRNLL
jgi:hypothetical protein